MTELDRLFCGRGRGRGRELIFSFAIFKCGSHNHSLLFLKHFKHTLAEDSKL